MALTLLPVGLIVAVIIEMASIRLRRVTVLPLFKFSVTGLLIAVFLLTKPLSATVLVNIWSLIADVSEIRSITGVYGEGYRLLFYDAFLPDTSYSPLPAE